MTGHGDATLERDGLRVTVEAKTVNNRYFKLTLRGDAFVVGQETRVERLVRQHIRRGHVHLATSIDRTAPGMMATIDEPVLKQYIEQLTQVTQRHPIAPASLDTLLQLPGVMKEPSQGPKQANEEWPVVQQAITAALERLQQMRSSEGAAMLDDLQDNCRAISVHIKAIEQRSPTVVHGYRQRLTERINSWLDENEVANIQSADVVREVGLFTERCDTSEETVRLASHLDQFVHICGAKESQGRKLEFVIQEMFREANTIGSKANDAEISAHVVDIKTRIERMREMVQNVE